MAIDFLIVGGGIGGAVLANLLSQTGREVVVLERDRTPAKPTRPEILWPATVQVLQSLIPKSQEDAWRLPLAGIVVTQNQQTLLNVSQAVFTEIGVQPNSTDPTQTREQLLSQGRFEVRRGIAVTDVLQEHDRVVGVRALDVTSGTVCDILAHWTVGDDGGRSLIRQRCGLQITPRLFPIELLTFRFEWPTQFPPATVRICVNPNRRRTGVNVVGSIPLPNGQGVGLIPVNPRVFHDESQFQAALNEFGSNDSIVGDVLGTKHFPDDYLRIRPAWGHAPRYGIDGAVLIGDAAHPVTPAGGQGANMSVADAVSLAEVVTQNHSPSQVLSAYEQRRRPANCRSMAISHRAAGILSLPGFLLNLVFPLAVNWINRRPARIGRPLRFLSTAFQSPTHGGGG